MRIAIISFDQEFSKKIKESLSDEHNVRIYIDSLGMLRDLKEFTPDIIIYDASAGEFAIDDLKFLMTRDKLENIEFKIFISKIEPINVEELPKKIPKEIYYKEEDDINKLIVKLKSANLIEEDLSQDLLMEESKGLEVEEKKESTDLDTLLSQSPEDLEDLLMGGDISEEKPAKKDSKKEEKKEEEKPSDDIFLEDVPLDEIESVLSELSFGEEEKKEEKPKEEVKKKEIKESPKKKEDVLDFNPEDIEDLLGLATTEEKKEEKPKEVKKEKKVAKEDFLADIEDLLSTTPKKPKVEEKKEEEKKEEKLFKTEDIEDLLSDIGLHKEEKKKEEKKEEKSDFGIVEESIEAIKSKQEPIEEVVEEKEFIKSVSTGKSIKLEINISEDEIKRLIVNETVNRMVKELKNDQTLKELIENVQKDFIDRTEKELEGLKEVVKLEVKTRLLKKIEEDLKEKIKESIKRDVMEITTKLVKQKLEQIFGK
ncbi:MAG: hypothetical protein DSY66_05800 [Persephonella sp.]|nr:MAG: hypothetical protein DSY66_05800 [Persephonella sp.]